MAQTGGKSKISGRQSAARPIRRRPRFVVVGLPAAAPALLRPPPPWYAAAPPLVAVLPSLTEAAKLEYVKVPEEQQEYMKILKLVPIAEGFLTLLTLQGPEGKAEYLRNHQLPNPMTYVTSKGYSFVQGQTEILSTKINPLKQKGEVTAVNAMEERSSNHVW